MHAMRRLAAGLTLTATLIAMTLLIAPSASSAPPAASAPTAAPAPPTELSAGGSRPGLVTVSGRWSGTAADNGQNIEFRYRVIVDGVPGQELVQHQRYTHSIGSVRLSQSISTDPTSASTVVVAVTATTPRGTSQPAHVTVPKPTNARVVSQDGDEVTIAWDGPRNVWVFNGDELLTKTLYTNTVTVKRLAPGTTHQLTVQSPGGSSQPVQVTTAPAADTQPPSTPVLGSHVYEWGYCVWELTWTQSTDDVTDQSQIVYDLLEWDPVTGQPYVLQYDFARGTGRGTSAESFERVYLRAADEAGNVSGLSAATSNWG